MYLKNLIILFFIFIGISSNAQNIKFTGTAPKVVQVGERFRLIYELNEKGSDFRGPSMQGFNILSGPSVSSSSSIQIVNGNMTQSVKNSYTYIVVAVKEGKFELSPATVKVKRKGYKSNTLSIEVVKGNSNAATQQGGTSQKQTKIPSNEISNNDIFVRVNVSRRNIYQGEHILAVIKVYTKLNLAGFEDMKLPSYQGFWTQEVPTPQQIKLQRENVNGQIYSVGVIQKMLLFPQQTGEITVEPFKLRAVVSKKVQRRSRSVFDNFFNSGYQNVPVELESKSFKINVKPLPANKPECFTGAVGKMKMQAGIDKDSVLANDAITLTVRISGSGNIKLVDIPKINFPPDFDVYDPKVSSNVKNTDNGASGSKKFEYLIQPRHAGNFRIAPIKFSYFDVSTKKYKTLTTKEFNIKVGKGEEDATTTIVTGLSKEDVKFIGSDIRFIKTGAIKLKKKGYFIYGSQIFVFVYIISFLAFASILIIRRNQIKRNANLAQVKNRKANKISLKRLKTANSYLKANNEAEFYDEITKALWGYISDKLTIPVAELTKDKAKAELIKSNVDEELTERFLTILDECEYARFAPSSEGNKMQNIYKEASNVIIELEKKIN